MGHPAVVPLKSGTLIARRAYPALTLAFPQGGIASGRTGLFSSAPGGARFFKATFLEVIYYSAFI
jgi:hypothetical protein